MGYTILVNKNTQQSKYIKFFFFSHNLGGLIFAL